MGAAMTGMAAHGGDPPGRRAPSSSSATTCGRPCAWPPCRGPTSSTRGPTTRSGSVRTARPTSPSSTWRRCGPCRAWWSSGRPTPTRRPRPGGRRSTARTQPPSCLSRQSIPVLGRDGRAGRGPGCPGAATCCDEEGGPPDVVLVGTGSEVHVCLEAGRGCSGPRALRCGWCRSRAGSGSRTRTRSTGPRCCRPACRHAGGRGRRLLRLGPLRRRQRGDRHLRRLGAGRGGARPTSASPPTTWPSGPLPSSGARQPATWTRRPPVGEREGAPMTPTPGPLHRARAEPVARQPAPGLDRTTATWPSWSTAGVRGVTSNPTIFAKAIEGEDDYDEQFASLMRQGRSRTPTGSWSSPTSSTPSASCDPSTTTATGDDGFVSLEVAPALAHDTAGTVSAGPPAAPSGSTGRTCW